MHKNRCMNRDVSLSERERLSTRHVGSRSMQKTPAVNRGNGVLAGRILPSWTARAIYSSFAPWYRVAEACPLQRISYRLIREPRVSSLVVLRRGPREGFFITPTDGAK